METKMTVDEMAQKIVRDDIYCNVGQLVEFSIKMSYDGHDAPVTYEDLENGDPDFDSMDKDDLIEWINDNVSSISEDLETMDLDELVGICQDNYDGVMIYEYWAISEWLSDKLKERGEVVIDSYPAIWGRQTTGQSIYLDGVIRNIAKYLIEL